MLLFFASQTSVSEKTPGATVCCSALFNEGRTAEAAKYLRLAAAYDSKYNELLEQCEES